MGNDYYITVQGLAGGSFTGLVIPRAPGKFHIQIIIKIIIDIILKVPALEIAQVPPMDSVLLIMYASVSNHGKVKVAVR